MESLESIRMSVASMASDLMVMGGILFLVIAGLIWKNNTKLFHGIALTVLVGAVVVSLLSWDSAKTPIYLFSGILKQDSFSDFLRLLFLVSGICTVAMTLIRGKRQQYLAEYYALIFSIVLGANLLVMSENLLAVYISIELISISSYILTAFTFDKKATEGSLKYFIFGAVSSAVMVYGFSFMYGLTGTLNFTSIEFLQTILDNENHLFFVAGTFSLAGFLYKIAAAPMHPWAPDVYETAPTPVVALFSVVPKLAGIGILAKFLVMLNLFGQSKVDWQLILACIILFTLTVGNFSALWQKNVKRLMAYSSIAQSGFFLIALLAFSESGMHFFLFYAAIYVALTFLVFVYIQHFENGGFTTIESYAGSGKALLWPSIFLLIGFIGLTGLPPTAGFTGKLFIFSALWDAYALSNKPLLLWVLIFGILNTVVSLFYYLRIPYYAFIRPASSSFSGNNLTLINFLGSILVLAVLLLFFSPGLLMGWINKITFVF
jgi:NADH-quinone oxidoreductase subunit N